jgi:GNAT superfamily N-acetyltransferase
LDKPHPIRPVNLATDLAPLADLIELVFASTMDEGGRAAIREMRYMSKMGLGLKIFSRMNEMMTGIQMGHVWIENERLIGNVSVYPSQESTSNGKTWIIANVGVHPEFQGRGIALKLMQATLQMLAKRGGHEVILQVDTSNTRAIKLYEGLGFWIERGWITWRRSSYIAPPLPLESNLFITRRRRSEWQQEMKLASLVRSNTQGGLGWQRPIIKPTFVQPIWRELLNSITMNEPERLIVRNSDETDIVASAWIENGLGAFHTKLTMFNHPDHNYVMPALLNSIVRRFRSLAIYVEHPHDDDFMNELFFEERFVKERSLYHMRIVL